jgi:hypothetical protein
VPAKQRTCSRTMSFRSGGAGRRAVRLHRGSAFHCSGRAAPIPGETAAQAIDQVYASFCLCWWRLRNVNRRTCRFLVDCRRPGALGGDLFGGREKLMDGTTAALKEKITGCSAKRRKPPWPGTGPMAPSSGCPTTRSSKPALMNWGASSAGRSRRGRWAKSRPGPPPSRSVPRAVPVAKPHPKHVG